MLRILPVVLLVACSGQHRPVGTVDAPITDSTSLARIELENIAGEIQLRAAEPTGANAGVRAEVLLVDKRPDTDFVAEFARHVEMVRDGDRLTIRSRHAGQPDHNDWHLRFELRVPPGVALDLRQVAGSVSVQLPRARDVEIRNTAGQVDLDIPIIEGRLAISSQAGGLDIRIADRGPTAGCDVECTAGGITLTLPAAIDGEFELSTTAGNIDLANRFGLDVKRSVASASVKGTVGQGGPRFRVRSTAGSVEVR